MKKIGVFIGRLQPMHNAHLSLINIALQSVEHLIVVLGSDCQAKTIKNPWTSEEREGMIRDCLTEEDNKRVSIIRAKDYLYNDNLWLTSLQNSLEDVEDVSGDVSGDVTLFGHQKDRSTFYLNLFPEWKFHDVGNLGKISATKVRTMFFHKNLLSLKNVVPEPIYERLRKEMNESPEYERLYSEHKYVEKYKQMWEGAPFPPTFNTVDAVVVKSGHVLVVRRGGYPGKGLIALPGGFLQQDERILDGCLRELKEETGIKLPVDELRKRIIEQEVFDHPDRSLRGRTITYAFCLNLGAGSLPKVKGSDDADKAWWMPLREVMRQEESFFEDHFHIINFFTSRF